MASHGLLSAEETHRLSVSSFHGFHRQPSPARILKKLLLFVCLIAGFSSMPAATFAEPAECQAWRRQLPDTPMPKFLRSRVVSIKFVKLLKFYDLIKKKMLSPYSRHFCHSTHLHCEPHVTIPSLEGSDQQYLSQYFNSSEISLGRQVAVPDLGNDYPGRAFINNLLETKLHFSSNTLREMLQMLNIPEDSRLAKYMNQTLFDCEMPDADCMTSLEKMMSLVLKKLGRNLEVLRTKWSKNVKSNKMRVVEMTFKGSHESKKSVVCSEEMFPYAVYKCYEVEDVHNIEVTMETEDGKTKVNAVMQCYSQQRKGVRVFAATEWVPNLKENVCHWLTEKDIVFVEKDKADKKKKMMKKHHFWRVLLPSTIPIPLP